MDINDFKTLSLIVWESLVIQLPFFIFQAGL